MQSGDAVALEQRLTALEVANAVRIGRARLKAELKQDLYGVRVRRLIARPSPVVETMRVAALLRTIPSFGAVKVEGVMRQVRISSRATVGSLSDRQRADLVARIEQDSARRQRARR